MRYILCTCILFLFHATTVFACPNGSTLRVRAQQTNSQLPPRFFQIGEALSSYEYANNQRIGLDIECSTSKFVGEGMERNAKAVVVTCKGTKGGSISIPISYAEVMGGDSLPVVITSSTGMQFKLTAGCFAAVL